MDGRRARAADPAWLDQLPTSGALTQLPSDKLAEVLEGAGATIAA